MTYTLSLELTKENILTSFLVIYVLYKFCCFSYAKSQVLKYYYLSFYQFLVSLNRTIYVIGDYVCQKMIFDRIKEREQMSFYRDFKYLTDSVDNKMRENNNLQRANLNLKINELSERREKEFYEHREKLQEKRERRERREREFQRLNENQLQPSNEQFANVVEEFIKTFPPEIILQKLKDFKEEKCYDETKQQEKKPLAGYFLFAKEKRNEILKENPNMKVTEVTSKIGQMWRNLSEEEKNKYQSQQSQQPVQRPVQQPVQQPQQPAQQPQQPVQQPQQPVQQPQQPVQQPQQPVQRPVQQPQQPVQQPQQPVQQPQQPVQRPVQQSQQPVQQQGTTSPDKILEEQLKNFVGQLVQQMVEPKKEEESEEYDNLDSQ
jgi:hypothetical protein